MKTPPENCLTCGAAAEPGQEYCLECGARVVPARRFSAVGRAWERKWGRYPGDWLWVALLLLLVAAGSATAGIVARRDTGAANASQTIVATSPVVAAPQPPAGRTTTTTAKPAPKPPTPRPTPKPANALSTWPARDGYTVVLASIPARGNGLAEATAKAKEALGRGSRTVGVLTSSKFASLHPGYYVVFVGIYDSLEEAQTAARRVSGRFPNAYARQVTR